MTNLRSKNASFIFLLALSSLILLLKQAHPEALTCLYSYTPLYSWQIHVSSSNPYASLISTHTLFLSSLSYHTFVLYSFLPITYCGSTLPIYISISLPLTPPISLYQYNAVPFQPNLFIFSLYLLIIQFYSHFSENGITLASHHHLHAYLCPPLCHILVTRLSINITSFLLSHQTYKSWIMHSCHKAQTSIIPMQYNQGY